MKVHKIRQGFACNSSSSHSVVLLRGGATDDYDGFDFGWAPFTLVSEEAKRRYVAALIKESYTPVLRKRGLPTDFDADLPAEVVKEIGELAGVEIYGDSVGYVDHQSRIELPVAWDESAMDRVFLEDFKAWILQPDVAILGGNDNGGEHPLLDDDDTVQLHYRGFIEGGGPIVARKDKHLGFWTMFSRFDGTKIRFDFDGNRYAPEKAAFPELVDVKITDYCNYGCAYCYQGSTPKGQHARIDILTRIAEFFGREKVFEVAIGGGEPTMHPGFLEILKTFRAHGVIPNFTTRNVDYLVKHYWELAEVCGAVALSVDSVEDALRYRDAVRAVTAAETGEYRRRLQVTVQYVVGAHPNWKETVSGLIRNSWPFTTHYEETLRPTFLGWKATGRGGAHEFYGDDGFVDLLVGLAAATPMSSTLAGRPTRLGLAVSLDTVLTSKFETELQAAGVSSVRYETREGKFSAYVDAVEGTVAPCSYEPGEGKYLSLDRLEDDFLAAFSRF